MTCEQQIRFIAALHCGRLSVAEQAVDNLASVGALEAAYWCVVVVVVVVSLVVSAWQNRPLTTWLQSEHWRPPTGV